MKTGLIFFFAIVSLVAARTIDDQESLRSYYRKCIANESFVTCGTACEPSCEEPAPTICTRECFNGCQCKRGFYRNYNKKCVKLEECSTECAANETFTYCHYPCTELKCPRKDAPVVRCMLMCQKGCVCSFGYARNMQGECIKISDCPRG